jgi:hypothetical protein
VIVHRMGWETFFATWQGPIALLHVDGAHTYQQVRDNLLVAVPWLAKGGTVIGDDWGVRAVKRAVREVIGEPDVDRATWAYTSGRAGPLAGTILR